MRTILRGKKDKIVMKLERLMSAFLLTGVGGARRL
jgi:hypothetical protein